MQRSLSHSSKTQQRRMIYDTIKPSQKNYLTDNGNHRKILLAERNTHAFGIKFPFALYIQGVCYYNINSRKACFYVLRSSCKDFKRTFLYDT